MKIVISGAASLARPWPTGSSAAATSRRSSRRPRISARAATSSTSGLWATRWRSGWALCRELRRAGYSVQEMRIVDDRGRKVSGISTEPLRRIIKDRATSLPRGDLAAIIYRTIEGQVETVFGDSISAVEEHGAGVRIFSSGAPRRFRPRDRRRRSAFRRARSRLRAGEPVREAARLPRRRIRGRRLSAGRVLVYVSHAKPGWIFAFSLRDDRTLFLFVFVSERHDGAGAARRKGAEGAAASTLRRRGLGMSAHPPGDGFRRGRLFRPRQPDPNGRVVERARMLIGDAACCVSLLGGEGAGLAMTEAYVLAGGAEAPGPDYREAFRRHEERLRRFIEGKQKAAAKFATAFAPKTRFGVWFRNQVTKLMGIPLVVEFFLGRLRDDFDLPEYEM